MKKVVVDTNVLISAFVFDGIPQKAILSVFRECEIFVTPSILQEYRWVPTDLFKRSKINAQQFQVLISGIASFVVRAKLIMPKTKIHLCRDSEDNKLLECCCDGKVNFLITGDKDLLVLPEEDLKEILPAFKILSPAAFLKSKF